MKKVWIVGMWVSTVYQNICNKVFTTREAAEEFRDKLIQSRAQFNIDRYGEKPGTIEYINDMIAVGEYEYFIREMELV